MNSPTVSEANLLGNHPDAGLDVYSIALKNVGVRFRIPTEWIGTFKEYMIRWVQRRIRLREFWALRQVSLTINRGEVFGLIGPNGAGKSTLLKLVARVLKPTEGRVWVKGRIAPLLEFGAAFHPDLTGRENIFLNGALLGFTHRDMEEKFTRIVDFAELWDFIDSPVRTYSSGMWLRLGFSIATDVQPDILIIDEIMSVGDEAFQHKSAARFQEFRDHGATILLVSHDLGTIERMCHRAAWLDHGHIRMVGSACEVTGAYRESQS
jgi:ABC-type polysaccharide/polyol phosphate transport system ATPase subunit